MPEKSFLRSRQQICPRCGGPHFSRREYKECGRKTPQPKTEATRLAGTPTTFYENDPLKGNPRDHALVRKHKKMKWPVKKLAKEFGISADEVREILSKSEGPPK